MKANTSDIIKNYFICVDRVAVHLDEKSESHDNSIIYYISSVTEHTSICTGVE